MFYKSDTPKAIDSGPRVQKGSSGHGANEYIGLWETRDATHVA